MKIRTLLVVLIHFLFCNMATAQDIIYTISGNYNESKTPIDSITIDNLTNGTRISFTDLPEHDFYQINLTKNSYWGTVDVFDIEEASPFRIQQNTFGLLEIGYCGNKEMIMRVSIIGVDGKTLFTNNNMFLAPQQSLRVNLGGEGLFFVKIETPTFTKTFKALGEIHNNHYGVEIIDGQISKQPFNTAFTLKNATLAGTGNFTFDEGDSIRTWAFRNDIYALPNHSRIKLSDEIIFDFKDTYYSELKEMAYPDSAGIRVPFLVDDDTMFCRKVNNEYIFQEDIIMDEAIFNNALLKGAYKIKGLNKLVNIGVIWPNATIFYTIDESLKGDVRVMNALLVWNAQSPVKFKKRENNEPNYVLFIKSADGTNSPLGMRGGKQEIRISDEQTSYGAVLHEMGHAAGLIHEHSRPDRNEHVKIHPECISNYNDITVSHNYDLFRKCTTVGSFDVESIMLYGSAYTFSETCADITWADGTPIKAQRSYLSPGDVKTLEVLYGFDTRGKPVVNVEAGFDTKERIWAINGVIEDDGESNIINKAVAWKMAGESDYHYEYLGGGTDNFTFNIHDLYCGEYYCFVTATNLEGSSTSSIQSLYVFPEISINTSDITESSALISIEIPYGGVSCLYSINCVLFKSFEEAQKGENYCKTSGELNISSNNTDVTLSGLIPDETYFLRVYMKSGLMGYSGYDDEIIEFRTAKEGTTGIFSDSRDGNEYKWVKIGDQTWMAENLAYMPEVSPPTDGSETELHFYVYDYHGYDVSSAKSMSNYTTYGALYNWPAAIESCPSGWHLPSDAEWSQLENFLVANGYNYDGTTSENKIAKSMAATTNWNTNSATGVIGNDLSLNNKSGFSALPCGLRWGNGNFYNIGSIGYLWSSTEENSSKAWLRLLQSDIVNVHRLSQDKAYGFSVRCIKDEQQESEIRIGAYYQGGIIFYIDDTGQHGLIAAQTDQSTGIRWYNGTYKVTGASGTTLGTGQTNTNKIVATLGEGNYAAIICQQLTLNGYSDWFLPSKDELVLLFNLDSEYKLTNNDYWSSTESGGTGYGSGAWYRSKNFSGYGNESYSAKVRAIRAF